MATLWNKGYSIDSMLTEFTVGRDHILDRELVGADCAGSIAHARMLTRQGYLTRDELKQLEEALVDIFHDFVDQGIVIPLESEDCHTWIENRLVEELGDAGKKIHLGRSRNDQVMTALRLFGREYLLAIRESLLNLIESLYSFAAKHEHVPMPGRTHMQIAMPSSLGLWASAFAQELEDSDLLLGELYGLYDRSPLGAAAGYGVPLNIDREYAALLMGFSGIHHNILAAQNSRGRLEAMVCDGLDHIGLTLAKAAQDLILFSLPEFGYFSLPAELCTGSSIMPQKKNPDGLELLRSRSASISGWTNQIKHILHALPSGYNRDYQDTKEPFLRCLQTSLGALRILDLSFQKLEVHEDVLRQAHVPEIYATDRALELVSGGMSFRDAYREVGTHLDELERYDPDQVLRSRTASGYPGNLGLPESMAAVKARKAELDEDREKHFSALENLLGEGARLIRSASEPAGR